MSMSKTRSVELDFIDIKNFCASAGHGGTHLESQHSGVEAGTSGVQGYPENTCLKKTFVTKVKTQLTKWNKMFTKHISTNFKIPLFFSTE